MDLEKVRAVLERRGEPGYRLAQILKSVYRDGAADYAAMTSLPAPLREELAREAPILSLSARKVVVSSDARAHKAALALQDGSLVESVLLKPKPVESWSACISTQVGCAMGCTFCATGLMGLTRNLTAEEISDQVLFWRQYLRAKRLRGELTNVVYMGMGEPLHNIENVFGSLRVLLDPARLALSPRHVAVSTVGLVPGIERFVAEFPQVHLALSLHAADDKLRGLLVPANNAYGLKELARVLEKVLAKTRRKVFLEYVLLAGENDAPENARDLAKFVKSASRPDLLHVNLIAFNPTDTPHRKPAAESARRFRDLLLRAGVRVTIRKNLGTDIQGACGQLITAEPKPE